MRLRRKISLNLLKYVVRPVKKVKNNDTIKPSEVKFEKTFSSLLKKYLNLTGLVSAYVPTTLGEIHYYDSNPNSSLKPLIFIHGLGCSGQYWWVLAKMLANKRRVIMLDLFHMAGYSKANKSEMNILHYIDTLTEFIKKISNQSVDLCGVSFGGWLAIYLAAKEKQLVHKLILMNPGGVLVKPFELRDTLEHLSWRKFKYLYPGVLNSLPYRRLPFFSSIMRRGSYRHLKRKGVVNLVRSFKAEHFVDSMLPEIECPVLLLWGREDKFLSLKIPKILMKKIKNIEGKWIDNCAHGVSIEAPVTCFKEINRFLNLINIKENEFARFMLTLNKSHKVRSIQYLHDF